MTEGRTIICTHMHTHAHTTHKHSRALTHAHTHTHTNTCTHMPTQRHTHTYARTRTTSLKHTHNLSLTQPHTHTHTHTRTHTRTHTHDFPKSPHRAPPHPTLPCRSPETSPASTRLHIACGHHHFTRPTDAGACLRRSRRRCLRRCRLVRWILRSAGPRLGWRRPSLHEIRFMRCRFIRVQ